MKVKMTVLMILHWLKVIILLTAVSMVMLAMIDGFHVWHAIFHDFHFFCRKLILLRKYGIIILQLIYFQTLKLNLSHWPANVQWFCSFSFGFFLLLLFYPLCWTKFLLFLFKLSNCLNCLFGFLSFSHTIHSSWAHWFIALESK